MDSDILKVGIILSIALYLVYWVSGQRKKWKIPKVKFPEAWRRILQQKVTYYQTLDEEGQKLFEYKVQEFLLNCQITGVETSVALVDRILIAASAVIPIFAFPKWKYKNLDEVLLYPRMFSEDFRTQGEGRNILGMVGNGYMERKMILCKQALHLGFKNETDKRNTAIHEFIHLIDKMDGQVDGIPKVLLEKQYVIPWVDMIEQKIEEIVDKKSDIHPYAKTSRIEFFAVLGEYFFERPKLLRKKHPELYTILEQIFDQDLALKKNN
ncbi:MAG: M90 family metallopeptidase [Bacteroidota bacterium]